MRLKASESDDTRNADDIETLSLELSWTAAPNPKKIPMGPAVGGPGTPAVTYPAAIAVLQSEAGLRQALRSRSAARPDTQASHARPCAAQRAGIGAYPDHVFPGRVAKTGGE